MPSTRRSRRTRPRPRRCARRSGSARRVCGWSRPRARPTEDYAASVARLNGLLQAGAIDQETYNRALAGAEGELAGAQDRLLRQSRDWQDGVRRSLQDYVDASTDAASAAEAATTQAFATMEDALVAFVTTGKVEFGSLTESILADLTRLAVRQAITAPLAAALLGSGGERLGGSVPARRRPAGQAGSLPRRASSTRVAWRESRRHRTPCRRRLGLRDGTPLPCRRRGRPRRRTSCRPILRRGEAVLTPGQMKALGADRGSRRGPPRRR